MPSRQNHNLQPGHVGSDPWQAVGATSWEAPQPLPCQISAHLHCSVALRIGGGSSSCPPLAPTCGCQGSVQQEATLQRSLLSPGSPTPACPMCAALSWKQRWLQAASNIAVSQASVMGRGQALFWAWISEPRRSLVLSSIRPWRKVSVLLWSRPGRSLCCHLPRSSPGTPCCRQRRN